MNRRFGPLLLAMFSLFAKSQTPAPNLGPSVGAINAALLPGKDICAAISSLTPGSNIMIPAGSYTCSATMDVPIRTTISGAGAEGFNRISDRVSTITYTGSDEAVVLHGASHLTGISLVIAPSARTGVLMIGDGSTFDHWYMTGGGSSTRMIDISNRMSHPNFVQGQRVTDGTMLSYAGIGIAVEKTVDTILDNIITSPSPGATTAIPLLIDSGASGIYASHIILDNAGDGVHVQHTLASGGWPAPNYMFFDQLVVDTVARGDCLHFDSSLGGGTLHSTFSNSWFAGCANNGVHISGGIGISFTAGTRIRANRLNGVLIDNPNVQDILIANSFIVGNNSADDPDAHGIYVTAARGHLRIQDNVISGSTTLNEVGHQQFAIKLVAGSSFSSIVNNDLSFNRKGPLSVTSPVESFQAFGNSAEVPVVPNGFVDPLTAPAINVSGQVQSTSLRLNHAGETILTPQSQTGRFTLAVPAATGTLALISQLPVTASLTTTAAESDIVTINGASARSHCVFSPTNSTAAANIPSSYISMKSVNSITFNHAPVAGMVFDILCSQN